MDSETPRGERSSRRATPATSELRAPSGSREHEPHERASKDGEGVPEHSEDFGPLTVERHRKDDGRALLLYELRCDPR
jgi:hypothetical protein